MDWSSEPEIGIARRYRLLHQAAYINATEKSGEEDREPVQRALQPTDENGWLTTDGVRNYRVCDTSATDFGKIGGAGLRVYFLLLKSLSLVSLACGVISLPAIFSYSTQEMYDQPEADAYAHLAGPARFGIGNIRVSETDIEAGKSCKICFSAPVIDLYTCNLLLSCSGVAGVLWLSSVTNTLVSIVLTLFTLWMGQHIKSVSDTVDVECVTMADYTVQIKPENDEVWEEFRACGKLAREKQKAALQQCVKQTLETAIPGSAIAKIGTSSPSITPPSPFFSSSTD